MSYSNTLPIAGSHKVSLQYAIQLTSRYRNNRELILDPAYKGQDILPFSETFNKSDIEDLLSEAEVAGLRIYYGMDSDNKLHALMVGVNDENEDLLPAAVLTANDPVIIQEGQRCPTICPAASPMNS